MEKQLQVKLTPRELSVLRLVANGAPNKVIAIEQGVTYRTVVNQRSSLYKKLNVHCTADLIRRAVQMKLIIIGEE